MFKRQLLAVSIMFVLVSSSSAMNHQSDKKTCVVYSHGFGESGEGKDDFQLKGYEVSNPIYPDAPGQIDKAVFYTKAAVHTLANHLHKKIVQDKNNSLVLIGRSCGAGTAFNCLAKLTDYDAKYFEGSAIKNKEEAEEIIAALNNGALINVVPFLSLRKANAVAIPSNWIAGLAVAVSTLAAYRLKGSSFMSEHVGLAGTKFGFFAIGAAAYSMFADLLKKICASGIVRWIVPMVTGYKFDPHHVEPIQSIELLRGKLTCPILLQCCGNDRVLENPDNETIKMYDSLKGDKTHIVITKKGWHNDLPMEFFGAFNNFKNRYINNSEKKNENYGVNVQKDVMANTQPTVDELREKIYPKDIKSVLSKNKAFVSAVITGMPLGFILLKNLMQL